MAKSNIFEKNPGLLLVTTYVVLLLTNSFIIAIANLLFPQNIVLGTATIPYAWAIALSMSKLSLIGTFASPFIREYEHRTNKMLTNQQWMLLYFVLNAAGLWLIARFAHIYGLGISSWVVAVILAIFMDLAQGMSMMTLEKYRNK
jgi:hypothetical protein